MLLERDEQLATLVGLLGLTNADIADRLFLSPRTVEHHVAAVMSNLDASTRTEAVSKAADHGLLTSPVPAADSASM